MRDDVVNLGSPADKVRVLYGGIDTEEFRFRNRSESRSTRLRILMCGRLIEKKGFAYGMKAFARLLKKHANTELRIVGGGPLRLKLELLAKILRLGESVSICGEKEPKDIPREIWDDLGRRGRKVVEEKFNISKQVQKLERIYQTLIDEHFG